MDEHPEEDMLLLISSPMIVAVYALRLFQFWIRIPAGSLGVCLLLLLPDELLGGPSPGKPSVASNSL